MESFFFQPHLFSVFFITCKKYTDNINNERVNTNLNKNLHVLLLGAHDKLFVTSKLMHPSYNFHQPFKILNIIANSNNGVMTSKSKEVTTDRFFAVANMVSKCEVIGTNTA